MARCHERAKEEFLDDVRGCASFDHRRGCAVFAFAHSLIGTYQVQASIHRHGRLRYHCVAFVRDRSALLKKKGAPCGALVHKVEDSCRRLSLGRSKRRLAHVSTQAISRACHK